MSGIAIFGGSAAVMPFLDGYGQTGSLQLAGTRIDRRDSAEYPLLDCQLWVRAVLPPAFRFGKTIIAKLAHAPNFSKECTPEVEPNTDYCSCVET